MNNKIMLILSLACFFNIAQPQVAQADPPYVTGQLGLTSAQIQQKFPSIIEQNLSATRVQWVLTQMTNQELSDLGMAYVRATAGATGKLDAVVIAHASPLTKIRWGQAKAGSLLGGNSGTGGSGAGGKQCPGCLVRGFVSVQGLPAVNVDMTFNEIYLEFRTATEGALSRSGAMFETLNFIASRTTIAYAAGYGVGTIATKIMERYCPDIMVTIGGTIDAALYNISHATTGWGQGSATAHLDDLFQQPVIYSNPGDYWSLGAQAATVGNNCDWCSLTLEQFFDKSRPHS